MTMVLMIMLSFFLFMILKPFYLQSSGSVGLGDICMMACFALLLGQKLWKMVRESWTGLLCTQQSSWKKCVGRLWSYKDFLLYCFLALATAVNLIYALRWQDHEFIKYSVFWFYNGFAIWTWRAMAGWYGRTFFKTVNVAAKFNLIVQYAVWVSGRGQIFHEYWGTVRYMGTFNDPNQMAFFLFMMLLLIWLYHCRYSDRSFWIFLVLSLPVLSDSKSTGIWLGMVTWAGSVLSYDVYLFWKRGHIPGCMLVVGGVCLLIALSIMLHLLWPPMDFDVRTVDYNLINRIREKIWKIANGGFYGLVLDRGAGRLFRYPWYLLFGAGEGGFARFADAGPVNELHSTWLSIWFCYGVVPMALMILWLRKVLKANTPKMWCAVLALFAESFFLINYRQPMFWMILMYADVTEAKSEDCRSSVYNCNTGMSTHEVGRQRHFSGSALCLYNVGFGLQNFNPITDEY